MEQKNNYELEVFYDAGCRLCHAEIEHYRKKDKGNLILFTDISHPEFDAAKLGLDPVEVNKFFHVKNKDGEYIIGVDAFILIWKTLPAFNALAKLSNVPGVKPTLKLGYKFFVHVRPYLPRRKCDHGTCSI